MTLNLATVCALLVTVGGLIAASLAGFFTAHPDLMTVLSCVSGLINAVLPKMITASPASASAEKPGPTVEVIGTKDL